MKKIDARPERVLSSRQDLPARFEAGRTLTMLLHGIPNEGHHPTFTCKAMGEQSTSCRRQATPGSIFCKQHQGHPRNRTDFAVSPMMRFMAPPELPSMN